MQVRRMTPTAIAYLVPEFPGQTHAFFWREIQALEEAGLRVQTVSTRRPVPGACPHDFAAAAAARTVYLFPPPLGAVVRLARRPVRTLRALAYVLGLSETPWHRRLPLLGLLGSASALGRICRRERLDHVHIHSCATAAHLGALAAILDDLSYSLTLHGDLPVYGTDHAAKMARARFVAAVTRPLAAQIAAVSPGTPAPVIWMGVDADRFRPAAKPAPRPEGAPLEVVTVARLNHTKGHVHLLNAMARLKTEGVAIRYRMAGDGPERAALEAHVARLGLQDEARFLGPLSEAEVIGLLHSADVLALTSFGAGEAAPVTVMEAMAAGLPTVVSAIGGTPDMIEDGVDGFLVPQRDETAIAAALGRLAADPDLRARIGAAARKTALARFDYRAQARALLEALRAAR
ncbi:glycosyltransferase involved in cell wall biosynthesis [Rhodovulum kholense]|uniref:Glycosyltransferase involved in cell wall biosynthesis n=2 Tax=Rhodovulum kholense TaxID=453584 RepID=A0A8E2VGK8_9RHOB|nr:glycosyltransferase involved in cell wall biosynthesis [Rhodovulum kholense]